MTATIATADEVNACLAEAMLSIGVARAAIANGRAIDLAGIEAQLARACAGVRVLGRGGNRPLLDRLNLLRDELNALEQDLDGALAMLGAEAAVPRAAAG